MTCCAHVQLPFGHLLTCCTFLNTASNPLIVSHDLLLSVACLRYPIACFTPHYLLPAYCVPQLPPFCVHDLLTDYCFLHDRLPTYCITQLAAYHNLQPVYHDLLTDYMTGCLPIVSHNLLPIITCSLSIMTC